MKSIYLMLVLCGLFLSGYAQNQQKGAQAALDAANLDALKKDKEKSDQAIADAKNAGKAATWLDRAKTYQSIAAGGNIRVDSSAATKAYEAYSKVVELDKDKKGGPGRLAKEAQEALKGQPMYGAFMQQGVAKFQSKNYADALKAMRMAGDINPKDTTAPLYTAIAAQQIKDTPTAKEQLEKYIANGGRDAQIYGSLSSLYRNDKEIDKALAVLDKGLALSPNNKDLSAERVNILLTSNRMDEAVASMKQLVEKDPNNAQNLLNLGILYDQQAQKTDAQIRKLSDETKRGSDSKKKLAAQKDALDAINGEITRLSAKVKKEPKNAEAKRQLSEVTKRQADTKASVATLEAQVKEDASKSAANADNEKQVAELKQKQSADRKQALDYYMKALAIDPSNYDANYSVGAYYYNEAAELNRQLGNLDVKEYQSAKGKELEGRVCGRFKKALPYFLKAKAAKDNEADLNEILTTLQTNLKQMDDKKIACTE